MAPVSRDACSDPGKILTLRSATFVLAEMGHMMFSVGCSKLLVSSLDEKVGGARVSLFGRLLRESEVRLPSSRSYVVLPGTMVVTMKNMKN